MRSILECSPYMQYTCAYWPPGTDHLDQAQLNKMELIGKKLDIRPGSSLLDIGCGWAGMGKYLTAHYDCWYTGINLARSHIDYALNIMRKGNDRVNVIQQDYRDTNGKFDRILCVGVSEHFGREYYRQFFENVHNNLKKDGIFLLQTVCDNITRLHADRWIEQTGLPNTYIPSLKLVSDSAEGLFITEDVHNLNTDYGKTMIAWERNVVKNWDQIRNDLTELDNDRFYRRWRYFLLFCAGQFFSRRLQLYQFIFTKVEDGRFYPTPSYSW